MIDFCFIDTPIGILKLEAESDCISKIKFTDSDSVKLRKGNRNNGESSILIQTSRQINEYFNGTRKVFEIPFKLDVSPFYNKVLLEVSDKKSAIFPNPFACEAVGSKLNFSKRML